MSYSPALLSRIKERVPLHDIIGHRVRWDARKSQPAKGDYWAPCPFHHEKSASFHVRDSACSYYCFGCGAKGDAISFLTDHDRMSFREAVEYLAEQAGVPLPKDDAPVVPRDDALPKVLAAAQAYFAQTPAHAARAFEYVRQRGFDQASVDDFGIGYAPDRRDGLREVLRRAGFRDEQGVAAGVLAAPEDGGLPYDRFRERIMFPVRDAAGKIISFAGRTLKAEVKSKYINGPETVLFRKGEVLFNLHQARAAASRCGRLIVCEGYFDVAAMHRAGFCEAVAPMGTALTEVQLGLLWRHAPEPVLCFDGDTAGRRAAMRALDVSLPLLKPGRSLRFAFLPEGADPDDFLRGGGDMAGVLSAAQPLSELLLHRRFRDAPCDTPERMAGAASAVRADVARIADPQVRSFYEDALREHMFALRRPAPRAPFVPGVRGGGFRSGFQAPKLPMPAVLKHDVPRGEAVMLGLLLARPDLVGGFAEDLAALPLTHAVTRRVRDSLLSAVFAVQENSTPGVTTVDSREEHAIFSIRIAELLRSDPAARRCATAVPPGFAAAAAVEAHARVRDELTALCARSAVRTQLRSAATDAAENNDGTALDRVRFLLKLRRTDDTDEPKDRQST